MSEFEVISKCLDNRPFPYNTGFWLLSNVCLLIIPLHVVCRAFLECFIALTHLPNSVIKSQRGRSILYISVNTVFGRYDQSWELKGTFAIVGEARMSARVKGTHPLLLVVSSLLSWIKERAWRNTCSERVDCEFHSLIVLLVPIKSLLSRVQVEYLSVRESSSAQITSCLYAPVIANVSVACGQCSRTISAVRS